MRRFLRHPSGMPVELVLGKRRCLARQSLDNIGLGGVACNSTQRFRCGSTVQLRIPLFGEQAHCAGVVAWCRRQADSFLVGVAFIDEDTLLRARMVEQVWQIEQYRRQRERELGVQQAVELVARDWIARFASDFARTA